MSTLTEALHILQANHAVDQTRAEGIASPRAGLKSPVTKLHSVPEWLSSPRSISTNSRRLSPEPSRAGALLPSLSGHMDRADSISPGSLHRYNVFSHPGSRRVSSEASAEAATGLNEHEADGAPRQQAASEQPQGSTAVQEQSFSLQVVSPTDMLHALATACTLHCVHQLADQPTLPVLPACLL